MMIKTHFGLQLICILYFVVMLWSCGGGMNAKYQAKHFGAEYDFNERLTVS